MDNGFRFIERIIFINIAKFIDSYRSSTFLDMETIENFLFYSKLNIFFGDNILIKIVDDNNFFLGIILVKFANIIDEFFVFFVHDLCNYYDKMAIIENVVLDKFFIQNIFVKSLFFNRFQRFFKFSDLFFQRFNFFSFFFQSFFI